VCVQKGYREMLEVLLRAGDTQTRDGQQQTAVMLLDDMRVPGREDMRRLLTSAESSQQQRQQQRQQQQLQQHAVVAAAAAVRLTAGTALIVTMM
jgi:hypothetical protein